MRNATDFTEQERAVLRIVQRDLPDSLAPFADIAREAGVDEAFVLELLRRLKEAGVIRRFGASVKHQKAGFTHNAMVAWKIAPEHVDEAGKAAALNGNVSHCYYRPSEIPDWPYTLYTMIHGKSERECLDAVHALGTLPHMEDHVILRSLKELKKISMTYFQEPLMTSRSHDLFARAAKRIPGGVNSPVRACLSVGTDPMFIASASGSRITSVDGREYIDLVESWGPLLLGHAHPSVTEAVTRAAAKGTSYGAPCEDEVLLAEAVSAAMPHVEMSRMVNSGTEAAMSALRLARAATKRARLIKFEGCYHGHSDAFLASAGSGIATLSIPGTPGVPEAVVADTLLAPYNDLGKVRALFAAYGKDIAAVIVEPVAGNMGLVLPEPGFLQGLRDLCDEFGSILIFDEVITGFRVAFGGAAARFGITPDLTTLGKIIGGGLPVGAYGGRRDLMEMVAPSGGVYQAGTLSGNPLAMAAGLATLRVLADSDYDLLEKRVETFCASLERLFADAGIPARINRLASMFTIFFTDSPVTDFASAKQGDTERYAAFYRAMRENGVALAPSAFEAAMISFAHSDGDLEQTLAAAKAAIAAIR